jgi:ATP-dependent Clp protease adaptor protein ClpS
MRGVDRVNQDKLLDQTVILSKPSYQEPRMYKVILFNDEVTTQEFVVEILINIFLKSPEEAIDLMMQVHLHGHAAVGVFSYDIARSRVEKALLNARLAHFPLDIVYEPEST